MFLWSASVLLNVRWRSRVLSQSLRHCRARDKPGARHPKVTQLSSSVCCVCAVALLSDMKERLHLILRSCSKRRACTAKTLQPGQTSVFVMSVSDLLLVKNNQMYWEERLYGEWGSCQNNPATLKPHQSHPNCIMLKTVVKKKRNRSASRMYGNHSSRNGMRMQLAWWDMGGGTGGHIWEGKDLSNLRWTQRQSQCHCHVLSFL